jgi:hypothetical protein
MSAADAHPQVARGALRPLIVLATAVAMAVTFTGPALADTRTEAAAKAILKKARADFLVSNFGIGAARLQWTLKLCGERKCTPATRATLLVALGAMQFKKGAASDAASSFVEAARLRPDITLEPPFDTVELRDAFAAANAGEGEGGRPPGEGAAPEGSLRHVPPIEQAADTPLPVFVDGGPSSVARVVVQYRAESSSAWKAVELKRVDQGWGGFVPCGDVSRGALRYYVEGLDADNVVVTRSGSSRQPYRVPIKETISGAGPHLPGQPPPRSCGPGPCVPGTPECRPIEPTVPSVQEDAESPAPPTERQFKRLWLGVSGEMEFMWVPADNDVCALDPATGLPANGNSLYCTTLVGGDFPARQTALENAGLCTAAKVASGLCPFHNAGRSSGGLVHANLRATVAIDYAITTNLLVGVRVGATFFPYPGLAAVHDGRTLGSPLRDWYAELRGTVVFGADALGTPGLKPILLLGGGVAQFDAHVTSAVAFCPAALPPPAGQRCQVPLYTGTVDLWRTSGPAFAMVGAGIRWAPTPSIALTAATRLNLAFHDLGVPIPTYGPELAAQYGF